LLSPIAGEMHTRKKTMDSAMARSGFFGFFMPVEYIGWLATIALKYTLQVSCARTKGYS
jgi:hypothetical protein